MSNEATWHRIEHSGFTADLPIWLDLARRFGPRTLEVGAGCGRVALHLAAHGVPVTAVERSSELLAALRASCPPGIGINVKCAAAEELNSEFLAEHELAVFPLLVVQLICADIGLEKGLDVVAQIAQACPRMAFSVMEELPTSFEVDDSPTPAGVPTSFVRRLECRGDLMELEHARFSKAEVTTEIELLRKVTTSDLSAALDRAPLETVELAATEGVLGTKVVLF